MATMTGDPAPTQQFGSIFLASRGAPPQGTLKLEGDGLVWRKAGGGKTIQLGRQDIKDIQWARNGREIMLVIKHVDGTQISFLGFRERDLEELKKTFSDMKERSLSVKGRNWGELNIVDSLLSFTSDGKTTFEVAMNDITQASLQGKNEVALEFQVDDTGTATKEDALVEMSFYVPPDSSTFVGTEDATSARVFLEQVLKKADLETSSDEIILSMPEVAVVVPRGRYEVQLHMTFLKLSGQSQDFKIRYTSIMRIFILPKVHQPQTLVVLSLDPPIRKGQTFYPHILFQFHNDDVEEVNLNITDEALEKRNSQGEAQLQRSFQGPSFEVFSKVLRGLAGVKISRPQKFKNHDGDGHCVRCSYKSDDGYLFLLERAFFYVQKPPLLILFDDVEYVEFQRQTMSQYSSAAKTFDLLVRTKGDTEYLFRSIQKQEWQNLFSFVQERNLKIENLKQVQQSLNKEMGGRAAMNLADDDDIADDESDEEDEDFMGDEEEEDDDDDSEEEEEDEDEDDEDEEEDDDDDSDEDDSDDGNAKKKPKRT